MNAPLISDTLARREEHPRIDADFPEILRNDPTTPEDELKLYGYSFTPLLYRQRYLDGGGKEGAFLVLTYAVGM